MNIIHILYTCKGYNETETYTLNRRWKQHETPSGKRKMEKLTQKPFYLYLAPDVIPSLGELMPFRDIPAVNNITVHNRSTIVEIKETSDTLVI